ncbi:gamma-glutamyl-gamma-aminobutyrate hydrolase family protein [Lactiplantibacillus paraplantarum]|uniref:gamma-glutamyl-gamma-aminobutyrate hydrolase family protein n=1 Tax=Lactiplantibacillus paraplantarum TaxID=60520 RepID=UPI000513266B|nr:gamma-glutamyl-gamma-aminobutyrate hydrolase family protein [Lactiplantibacillus paraplantarum]ALO03741.1 hypothetical protein ASU28_04900 [Lactiplantibacillus paraplantarum]KGE76510.1 hypothetical protein HR47_01070 [Lactiplantibacillus paraplantarum]
MNKLIGITADVFLEATGVINQKSMDFVPRPAVNAVLAGGGVPVSLPYIPEENINTLLDHLDGVIFTGGPDLDPSFMHCDPIPELGVTNRNRDVFEIALVHAAVAKHIPILGICRGAQIINVALGGTVYQDLKSQFPQNIIKHHQLAPGNQPTHFVSVKHDSQLFKAVGDDVFVNSRHHQAIKDVPQKLRIVACASDGVIEAIENADTSVQAVQWHPENMWQYDSRQLAIFKDFISRT